MAKTRNSWNMSRGYMITSSSWVTPSMATQCESTLPSSTPHTCHHANESSVRNRTSLVMTLMGIAMPVALASYSAIIEKYARSSNQHAS